MAPATWRRTSGDRSPSSCTSARVMSIGLRWNSRRVSTGTLASSWPTADAAFALIVSHCGNRLCESSARRSQNRSKPGSGTGRRASWRAPRRGAGRPQSAPWSRRRGTRDTAECGSCAGGGPAAARSRQHRAAQTQAIGRFECN